MKSRDRQIPLDAPANDDRPTREKIRIADWGLASMLDMNGNGKPLDDLLRQAGGSR